MGLSGTRFRPSTRFNGQYSLSDIGVPDSLAETCRQAGERRRRPRCRWPINASWLSKAHGARSRGTCRWHSLMSELVFQLRAGIASNWGGRFLTCCTPALDSVSRTRAMPHRLSLLLPLLPKCGEGRQRQEIPVLSRQFGHRRRFAGGPVSARSEVGDAVG
jgi:hypothetical protein